MYHSGRPPTVASLIHKPKRKLSPPQLSQWEFFYRVGVRGHVPFKPASCSSEPNPQSETIIVTTRVKSMRIFYRVLLGWWWQMSDDFTINYLSTAYGGKVVHRSIALLSFLKWTAIERCWYLLVVGVYLYVYTVTTSIHRSLGIACGVSFTNSICSALFYTI